MIKRWHFLFHCSFSYVFKSKRLATIYEILFRCLVAEVVVILNWRQRSNFRIWNADFYKRQKGQLDRKQSKCMQKCLFRKENYRSATSGLIESENHAVFVALTASHRDSAIVSFLEVDSWTIGKNENLNENPNENLNENPNENLNENHLIWISSLL